MTCSTWQGSRHVLAGYRLTPQLRYAVARFRISTSSRSRRFSRRSAANSSRSAVLNPPSWRVPASRPACMTHARTAVSDKIEVLCDLADRAVTALAQLDDLSLELRRERTMRPWRLPTRLALHNGHPSGAETLISDVRQSGVNSRSGQWRSRPSNLPWRIARSLS